MSAVAQTLGVLVGGLGFNEVKKERRFADTVRAAVKIFTYDLYYKGRDEFLSLHKFNKRFVIVSAITSMHLSFFMITLGLVIQKILQEEEITISHIKDLYEVGYIWLLFVLCEGWVFTFLKYRYPQGATGSQERGAHVVPTLQEGGMEKVSDQGNGLQTGAPINEPVDLMTWLSKQPKMQELISLADQYCKNPDDLKKIAESRHQDYNKAWGANHSQAEDFQPLTR